MPKTPVFKHNTAVKMLEKKGFRQTSHGGKRSRHPFFFFIDENNDITQNKIRIVNKHSGGKGDITGKVIDQIRFVLDCEKNMVIGIFNCSKTYKDLLEHLRKKEMI